MMPDLSRTERDQVFWAIKGPHGFYVGTHGTRADMIAEHVHGRFEWTEGPRTVNGKLQPLQRREWAKCKRYGDRAVRVRLSPVEEPSDA